MAFNPLGLESMLCYHEPASTITLLPSNLFNGGEIQMYQHRVVRDAESCQARIFAVSPFPQVPTARGFSEKDSRSNCANEVVRMRQVEPSLEWALAFSLPTDCFMLLRARLHALFTDFFPVLCRRQ